MAEKEIKNKICPLSGQPCMREYCALYVRLQKPRILRYDLNGIERKTIDPTGVYVFEGCGLLNQIPWRLQKIPIVQK